MKSAKDRNTQSKPRHAWWSDEYHRKTGNTFSRFLKSNGKPTLVSAVTVDKGGDNFKWSDKKYLGEVI